MLKIPLIRDNSLINWIPARLISAPVLLQPRSESFESTALNVKLWRTSAPARRNSLCSWVTEKTRPQLCIFYFTFLAWHTRFRVLHSGLRGPHADAGVAPLLHEGDEAPVADDDSVGESLQETLLWHCLFRCRDCPDECQAEVHTEVNRC